MNGTEETERGRDGGWRCAGASRIGYGLWWSEELGSGHPKNSRFGEKKKLRTRIAVFNGPVRIHTMPAPTTGATSSKKRKNVKDPSVPSSKRRAVAEDPSTDAMMSQIAELEVQISESRKYYNNIATLLSMLDVSENAQKPNLAVAVSLCRVFSRLIAGGNMTEANRAAENEKIIVAWLKERCQEYHTALIAIMREGDASAQVCAFCPAVTF